MWLLAPLSPTTYAPASVYAASPPPSCECLPRPVLPQPRRRSGISRAHPITGCAKMYTVRSEYKQEFLRTSEDGAHVCAKLTVPVPPSGCESRYLPNMSSISRPPDVHFHLIAGYLMSLLADLGFVSTSCRTPLHFSCRWSGFPGRRLTLPAEGCPVHSSLLSVGDEFLRVIPTAI